MKHLSIHDIVNVIQKKNERRLASFEKILLLITARIKQCVNINMYSCLYEVPEYLLGHPTYDLNECLTYIIEKLQKNGFYVDYYFPRVLHISWNNPAVPKLPSNPTVLAPRATIQHYDQKSDTIREKAYVKAVAPSLPPPPAPLELTHTPTTEMSRDEIEPAQEHHSPTMALPQPILAPIKKPVALKPKKTTTYNKTKVRSITEFKPSGRFVLTSGTDPESESAPS